MLIDVESLVAEAPEAPPCGPDLDGKPAFFALDETARGRPERQKGAAIEPAEPPVWKDVLTQATSLLVLSKDLRIAMHLVRAAVRVDGIAELEPGLRVVRELIERYGSSIHPRIADDDNGDPRIRLTALGPLTDAGHLLGDVRNAILIRTPKGSLTVRDVEIALGVLQPLRAVTVYTKGQVEAMIGDAGVKALASLRVTEVYDEAKRLEASLDQFFGPLIAPDMKPLLTTLYHLAKLWKEQVAPSETPTPEHPAPTGDAGSADAAPVVASGPGQIRSRDDAVVMIDRIVDYLEKNEPTNPAALLLRRGKRFMTMNFVDIVKEISPDSIAKIEAVVGPSPVAT